MNTFADKKKTVSSPLATWVKRRRLVNRLEALSDAMLDDIGIQRFDISEMAERAFPKSDLIAYAVAVTAAVRKNLKQRRSTRQLVSLDDRMLADIGLQRSEISGAVRGDMPFRAFALPNIMSVSRAELVHAIPELVAVSPFAAAPIVASAPVAADEEKHRIAA